MSSIRLDWTDAYIGKMTAEPFAGRLGELAAQLGKEVGEGILPFLTLPFADNLLNELDGLKDKLAGFEHMLLLGIGGSALGARALQKAFLPGQDRPGHKGPWLWIADNVDADTLETWFADLPPEKTMVVVVSKSGGTIETASQYFLALDWLKKHLGEGWKKNIFIVTDAVTGSLRQEVEELGLASLPVPDNLGGRYSVLSAVGLLPAAFMGLDYRALVRGALDASKPVVEADYSPEALGAHPSWKLALWCRSLIETGHCELIFFSYIPLWSTFGAWFCQLWAESLGKDGRGSMPLASVGVTDQHSVNQMYLDGPRNKGCIQLTCESLPMGREFPAHVPDQFGYLRGKKFGELIHAEALGTRMALSQNQVPLVNLDFAGSGEYEAGKMIMLLELATVLTGWLLEINPLDQPAVELGKRLAKARLGADGLDKEKGELSAFLSTQRETQEL